MHFICIKNYLIDILVTIFMMVNSAVCAALVTELLL